MRNQLIAMIALAGCQGIGAGDDTDQASAFVGTTTTIPGDGACAHIVATRLADFHVSEYRGPLAGASFSVSTGETRVTAVAYAAPCSAEPPQPPWIADAQLITFTGGANTLTLAFHRNANTTIDPTFDDESSPVSLDGAPLRIGRNGEDAAGPGFALDGWDVKLLGLPPGATETVLFSLEGKGPPYSPRGLARLPDGRFVAQVGELGQPLWVFDAAGNFLETWTVNPGAIRWDFSDGLEAIDATHLVHTFWLNAPINCAPDGTGCIESGIEVLTIAGTQATVTAQLPLPEPLNLEFAVGVTPVGANFAVTTLPDGGGSRLVLISGATGAVLAGPTAIAGSVEGLFITPAGAIGALDYHGNYTAYNAADLTVRAGESASYPAAAGLSNFGALAWNSAAGELIAMNAADRRIVSAPQSFATVTEIPIDLSFYVLPSSLDYRADTNQLAIVDRLPPLDFLTGARIPTVDFFDLPGGALAGSLQLQQVPLPVRTFTVAHVAAHGQLATHYRRPGGVADSALDARVFLHNLDGTLASSFDLAPFGFPRVSSVNYLPATDELLVAARDMTGTLRLVVTSAIGQPRRSYRVDAITGFADVAQLAPGADSPKVGVLIGQPSEYVRVTLAP